jgi:hypothetical protein
MSRAKSDGSSGEKYNPYTDEVSEFWIRREGFQRGSWQSNGLFTTEVTQFLESCAKAAQTPSASTFNPWRARTFRERRHRRRYVTGDVMSDSEVEVTSEKGIESGMSFEEKDQTGIGRRASSVGRSQALGYNKERRS